MKTWQGILKRLLDLSFAVGGMIFLSPLFAILALLIKLDSRGPVFYVQERVGQGGRPFHCIKFRTMVPGAEKMGLGLEVAQNDARITRVGAFLRHWSLDELPQLINVLKGEMSLVGPRPGIISQVARYTPWQKRRLEVNPGLTGWAQVNGRNAIDWARRIELDVWYIDHWTLWLDLSIIFRTFGVLLRREGLYGKDGIARDFQGGDGIVQGHGS